MESRGAQDGERKTITALFADIKGSVEMMEGLDPEEARSIVDPALQLMMDAVHRYEGYVAQSRGDGIFALFGAPIAQEDHARRALHAALRMQEDIKRYSDRLQIEKGVPLQVRVGLNSGEMVLRSIRKDDLHTDYVPIGHSVNLAARMESLATPGSIAVSESTFRAAEGYFRFREVGPVAVKGLREPVRVYELDGVGALHTPLEVSRSRGFSRFVGRVNETATLEAALNRAIGGSAQVVGIVGDPGVGKSRLCFEFLERCRVRGLPIFEAHGVAHGKSLPLLPMLELFRSFFGITEEDTDQAAREKIAGRFVPLDESLRELLPLVFDLLGVSDPERPAPPMQPDARQRQLVGIVKRVTQMWGRRQPAVAFLEDLHWFDGGSEAFLEPIVEALPGTQWLVLVTFRPEYHAGWMQKSYYQQLPVLSLAPDAIAELFEDLLGADPSLAALGSRIRERTGGNPFFIEEVVQALAETGVLDGTKGAYRLKGPAAELRIPATVQTVLAARIDRLAEREKEVLETAAVIGRQFTEPVLQRVSELRESELAASLARADQRGIHLRGSDSSAGAIHVQACAHSRSRLQFASQRTAPDAPRTRGTGDRKPLRRPARRAFERTRASLQPQSKHGEGDRVLTIGGGARRATLGERGGHQPSHQSTGPAEDVAGRVRAHPAGARLAGRSRSPAASCEGTCRARGGQGVRPRARALSAGR